MKSSPHNSSLGNFIYNLHLAPVLDGDEMCIMVSAVFLSKVEVLLAGVKPVLVDAELSVVLHVDISAPLICVDDEPLVVLRAASRLCFSLASVHTFLMASRRPSRTNRCCTSLRALGGQLA